MDYFKEYMVKHRYSAKEYAIIAGVIIAAVLILILASPLLANPGLSGFYFVLVAGVIYGASVVIKRTNIEYEYILTNNELDVDRISAKSIRKRITTINFASIDICAAADDADHKREFENTSSITKTFDCTGDGKYGVYFIDFTDENGRKRLLFQPPVSMLENAKRYNPSKIFIN